MSFIGLVTQKEQRNGVYLQAKVIAPNKNLSKTANFKVVVEPQGADDYMLCVIDNARARSRISAGAEDIEDIRWNIGEYLVKAGLNKTVTEYTFENIAGAPKKFLDYMNSEGELIKRPLYGEGTVSGILRLRTYKKNLDGEITAEVTTTMTLSINSPTAEEILAAPEFTRDALWDKMVEGTDNDNAAKLGWERIRSNLKMKSTYNKTDFPAYLGGDAVINCSWSVTDIEVPARIQNDGTITSLISYDAAAAKYKTALETGRGETCEFNYGNLGTYLYFTFKGIKIEARLSLGDTATKSVTFDDNVAIQSKALTNSEIAAKVYDKLTAKISSSAGLLYGDDYTFTRTSGESDNHTVTIDSNTVYIDLPRDCSNIEIPEYMLTDPYHPVSHRITYTIKNADGTAAYAGESAGVLVSRELNASTWRITLNKAQMLSGDNYNQFSIQAEIEFRQYSGESLASAKSFLRLYINAPS